MFVLAIFQGERVLKGDFWFLNSTFSSETKNKNNINVKDFGAKGNGKSDDTKAIQEAIDAVDEQGGIVYLPPGTYLISDSLLIKNKGKIKIKGSGFSSVIKAKGVKYRPVNFSLITLENSKSSKFYLSDVLFQMEYADQKKASAISTKGSVVDASIKNCWFSKTNIALKGEFITLKFIGNTVELGKSGGISIKGSNFRKVLITNNHFFANNEAHIKIYNEQPQQSGVNNISITGNQFDQGLASSYLKGFSSKGDGINLQGVSYFTIDGNNFNGYTPNKKKPVRQIGHAIKGINCNNFILESNTYHGYVYSAIYLKDSSEFNVQGTVKGFDQAGISIENSDNFGINAVVTDSKVGIVINNSSRFNIRGVYSENLEYGMLISQSSQGLIEASATNNNLSELSNRYNIFLSRDTKLIRVINSDSPDALLHKKNEHEYNIVLDSTTSNNAVSSFNPLSILNNGTENKVE